MKRAKAKIHDDTFRIVVAPETLVERLLHQKQFLTEQALEHWLKHRNNPCSRDFEFGSWLAKANAAAAIAVEMELACWSWQREQSAAKIAEAKKHPSCLEYFKEHYPTINFDAVIPAESGVAA